ncbi:MAG: VanW like protein, partial [Frankiales bacterium]|nr:VanW like protein [Frankiales bacterium]
MRRPLLLAGAAVGGLLLLGYGSSFLLSGDKVPRGVHVLGVDLSGLSAARAEQLLARELAGPAAEPLELVADDVRLRLEPLRAGMRVDLDATVDEARSAGPLDRLRGLLGTRRDVVPEPEVREEVLSAALRALAPRVDRKAREGTVVFRGVTPTAMSPETGRTLDVDRAADAVRSSYLRTRTVELPVDEVEVQTTDDQVQEALTSVAQPAVAAPVTLDVGGRTVQVRPVDIAAGLTFSAALKPEVDGEKVLESLGARVEAVEVLPRDATFRIVGGKPVLVPSVDGQVVPAAGLSAALLPVLARPAPRTASVALEVGRPRVTTEQAA